MGRSPRCTREGLNKGAWTADENKILKDYVNLRGEGKWSNAAKETGLKRCGKSCRLRWMNYLRPNIKRGNISQDEEELIIRLHKLLGNRWSLIAGRLPGRTDNEIKNHWNTNLTKKVQELQSTFPKIENKQTANEPCNELEAPPNSARMIKSPPNANDVDVFTPEQLHNSNEIAKTTSLGPPAASSRTYHHHKRDVSEPSDKSPLYTTAGEENSSGFVMDFKMEELCKFLDMDLSNIHMKVGNDVAEITHGDNSNGNDIVNGCQNSDRDQVNLAEGSNINWDDAGGNGSQGDLGTDLMSLSSFLDAADEESPEGELDAKYIHPGAWLTD